MGHGAATLALAPLFFLGLVRTRRLRQHTITATPIDVRSPAGLGRALLLVGAGDCRRLRIWRRDRLHPAIGYRSFTHLAPAVLGGLVYAGGLVAGGDRIATPCECAGQ